MKVGKFAVSIEREIDKTCFSFRGALLMWPRDQSLCA